MPGSRLGAWIRYHGFVRDCWEAAGLIFLFTAIAFLTYWVFAWSTRRDVSIAVIVMSLTTYRRIEEYLRGWWEDRHLPEEDLKVRGDCLKALALISKRNGILKLPYLRIVSGKIDGQQFDFGGAVVTLFRSFMLVHPRHAESLSRDVLLGMLAHEWGHLLDTRHIFWRRLTILCKHLVVLLFALIIIPLLNHFRLGQSSTWLYAGVVALPVMCWLAQSLIAAKASQHGEFIADAFAISVQCEGGLIEIFSEIVDLEKKAYKSRAIYRRYFFYRLLHPILEHPPHHERIEAFRRFAIERC